MENKENKEIHHLDEFKTQEIEGTNVLGGGNGDVYVGPLNDVPPTDSTAIINPEAITPDTTPLAFGTPEIGNPEIQNTNGDGIISI